MRKIIVVTGPTCTGKTKLSIELAKKYDGEVINADSTQIYRGMDIATAKVTEQEKEGISHYLFDIKDWQEDYSIYHYQKDVRKKIEEIWQKNKTVILCGGTGLYIKSALFDYDLKEENIKKYEGQLDEELYRILKEKDPDTLIHPNNRKRIERALSYIENHQQPIQNQSGKNTLLYDAIFLGLTMPRDILYDRINKRVDQMINTGLIKEAETIFESKIRSKAVMTPIGYKELFPYFEKKESFDACVEKIKQNSRRYAKRQYTFFRHQLPIHWIDVDLDNFQNTVDDAIKIVENS